MPASPPHSYAAQTGFTLIEVLVSIVILSFGLLGIAGMQAASLKISRDSQHQATGVLLAREYAELMRNNIRIAELTTGTATSGNRYLIAHNATKPTAASKDCRTNKCTSSDIAQWDRDDWLMRVHEALPDAKVEVCFDNRPFQTSGNDAGLPKGWGNCDNTGNTVMIKIGWLQTAGKTETKDGKTVFTSSLKTSANALPSIVLPVVPGGAFGAEATPPVTP